MTEILAWCVLGAFYVFIIGPALIMCDDRFIKYWEAVAIGLLLPVVCGVLVGLVLLVFWAVMVVTS